MGTDWRNTTTPQDEVNEFTDTGVLVPYQEFLNSDGFELAASLGDAMEDHVAAEIFRRNASDTTLIRVTALALQVWIICRTRSAYLASSGTGSGGSSN